MASCFCKIRRPVCCLAASIMVHLLIMYMVRLFGPWTFGAPINLPRGVVIELAAATPDSGRHDRSDRDFTGVDVTALNEPHAAKGDGASPSAATIEPPPRESESIGLPAVVAERDTPVMAGGKVVDAAQPVASGSETALPRAFPSTGSSTIFASNYEKLSYTISMFGATVGNAELEAKNENGAIFLSLRVRSNDAISAIYPVDDLVETRHIDGRFIMTKIRQQEGAFRNEAMFTINPGRKRVTWTDPASGSGHQANVPSADVVDTLSGIYCLRSRVLHPGQTETLHIFDSETYADVPVDIIRREELLLPNLSKVATLVIRPLQSTAGIFRRTGDIHIWLTDDDHKVPVKIVTTVALGKVTAELVAAESKPSDDPGGTIH